MIQFGFINWDRVPVFRERYRTRLRDLLDKMSKGLDNIITQIMMAQVKRPILMFVFALAMVMGASGCCNTQFKMKQLGDDIHSYFLDGDPELLSEAEPDSGI